MSDIIPIPRPEHPRPDFVRDTYMNLNGEWQFAFDDSNEGLKKRWFAPGYELSQKIIVPFCYQSKLSGICTEEIHPILWYRRSFEVPQEMRGKRIFIRFGAVDFSCRVFINGQQAGEHKGGYTPFTIEATHLLKKGENDLCLRVEDRHDCTQPRGKQYWDKGLMGCWYTPVSGIWQTVYMEAVGEYALTQIHVTPDIDKNLATIELALDEFPADKVSVDVTVSFKEKVIKHLVIDTVDRQVRIPVDMINKGDLEPVRLWRPGEPNLYDLSIRIYANGKETDHVNSYFGMRKVEVRHGQILLNNSPLYQRLILDQGYWPESLITPPSDEAIKKDIEYTLAFGFNGARKHQKLEDPRYYYWADKMGLIVWGEVPSPYDFADETIRNLSETFLGFIDRDFNHPSIIAWVPMNESWGVRQIYTDKRQQATGRMLYHMGKAADGTRLISSNDGWEQVTTDISALHDYAADKEVMAKHFESREVVEKTSCDWRMAFAQGETPTGEEAFMVTEYGGIAFNTIGAQGEMGGMETWGYHDKVTDEGEFLKRFKGVTGWSEFLAGFAAYAVTVLLLFVPLKWLSTRFMATLITGAVCMGLCFLPYDLITSKQVGLFIGSSSFACFPVMQYAPYLLAGIYWQTSKKHGLAWSMIGLGATLAGVVYTIVNGLPTRFPPSLPWVLLTGVFPGVMSFAMAKITTVPKVLEPVDGWLCNMGRRSLFYLLTSNLVIFALSGIKAAPMVTKRDIWFWKQPIASPLGSLLWTAVLIFAIGFTASLAGRTSKKQPKAEENAASAA